MVQGMCDCNVKIEALECRMQAVEDELERRARLMQNLLAERWQAKQQSG